MATADLPIPPSPLIGRADELAALEGLLARPGVRLVTLLGAAGVGKTRLAVAAAHRVAASGADVVFVPLAAVTEVEGLIAAMLAALGSQDAPAAGSDAVLVSRLRERSALVVLDNVEQIDGAAGLIAAVLERGATSRFLLTSRRALGVRAEHTLMLEPLAVPDAGASLEEACAAPAVEMLADRLAAADSGFVLESAVTPAVVRICRRVDGLPLALELVAARARGLPLAMIADALEDRVGVLDRGGEDLPTRQRTMDAALGWSVSLLTADAAALFTALGVFVGGMPAAGVDAVAAAVDLDRRACLDALDELVDQSLLVRVGQTAGARYRMLEVVRDLAAARLASSPEAWSRRVGDAHAAYFLGAAEEARLGAVGAEQVSWLERVQAEAANFTAAVQHAVATGDVEVALRLCVALRFLWYMRGPIGPGRALFAAALALDGAPAPLRSAALSEASALARHQADWPAADALTLEAVRCATGAPAGVAAAAWLQRGFVLHLTGRAVEAGGALKESLRLSQESGDRLGMARALHHLGFAARAGGEPGSAWELQCRALALFRDLGNDRHVTTGLIALVELARDRGDLSHAAALIGEAADHLAVLLDSPLIVHLAYHAAAVVAAEGHMTHAVRLLGAAEGLAGATGAAPWPAVAAIADEWLPIAQRVLGVSRVTDLLQVGRSQPDPRQACLALIAAPPEPDSGGVSLTAREREVAALVARGLTNGDIARSLVVSERTVEGHVARILAKRGFRSRAQIAAWVAAGVP